MRVAAVDIGTNTVRLLLAEAEKHDGEARLIHAERHEIITKLGEGLDASGRLGDEPMNRALAGLAEYADLISAADVVTKGGVATAATRSATNGPEFAERVCGVLGFHPNVIGGVEEARLTFLGATRGRDPHATYCVIDVGGGSTEFVVGRQLPDYAVSIDIGSVRLTERIETIGLGRAAESRAYVDELFARVVPPEAPTVVLGSGGTFVTLAAVACGVTTAEIDVQKHVVLTQDDVTATVDRLLEMTTDEIAGLPAVAPARAGVLQAGAVCAERAVAHIGVPAVRISVRDILDGLAMELAIQQWSGAGAPDHSG